MVAHHTVGGCNLRPGDLLGTGTISCDVRACLPLARPSWCSGAGPRVTETGFSPINHTTWTVTGSGLGELAAGTVVAGSRVIVTSLGLRVPVADAGGALLGMPAGVCCAQGRHPGQAFKA